MTRPSSMSQTAIQVHLLKEKFQVGQLNDSYDAKYNWKIPYSE